MCRTPAIAEQPDNERVPVGIQGRLREEEIGVGSLALADQLCRQQMEAFVPRERAGLRIDQQRGANQRQGGDQNYSNSSKLPFNRMSRDEDPTRTS
jgi:hypothetical protein